MFGSAIGESYWMRNGDLGAARAVRQLVWAKVRSTCVILSLGLTVQTIIAFVLQQQVLGVIYLIANTVLVSTILFSEYKYKKARNKLIALASAGRVLPTDSAAYRALDYTVWYVTGKYLHHHDLAAPGTYDSAIGAYFLQYKATVARCEQDNITDYEQHRELRMLAYQTAVDMFDK